MKLSSIFIVISILFLNILTSCDVLNDDWLEKKNNISLVIPSTLEDMRMLIYQSIPFVYETRGLAIISSDNLYVTTVDWNNSYSVSRYTYIWSEEVFDEVRTIQEWDDAYEQVFIANTVLEGLIDISPDNNTQDEYYDIKGTALFLRARAFHNLAQFFSRPYDPSTASEDLGIPLRLTSDINEQSVRATIEETYNRIVSDLKEAIELLRIIPKYKKDASRPAAYALLARVYLSMRDYENALIYADLSLEDYSTLLDYNTLNASAGAPFPRSNDEVIFHSQLKSSFAEFTSPEGKIDSTLVNSYSENDLRKLLFFDLNSDGSFSFKGDYAGFASRSTNKFGGIATDEVYLTRAECYARAGNTDAAMDDLNTLLEKRYESETFTPLTAPNAEAALDIILEERRKELLFRGLRWMDLRRLNFEPEHETTLVRNVNGQTFTLQPGDPGYVFPIPQYVIDASGIEQNPR